MNSSINLQWAFGFSKDKKDSANSLCLKDRNALFLTSSHSGVIYDFEHRTQTILQGHCNVISCCAVDKNKRWIVTADKGTDPILVVWDAISFVPVKTYPSPHENGVESVDISDDSLFVATLSSRDKTNSSEQEIALWAWTIDNTGSILRTTFSAEDDHHRLRFDKTDSAQIVSTGSSSIFFWKWDEYCLEYFSGKVSRTDLGNYGGDLVSTVFLPSTENAVTATDEGYIIVWESKGATQKGTNVDFGNSMKEATKVLKLVDCAINIIDTTTNDYLVMGCADGAVRFYDYFLRLEAWFEDLNAGPVTSVSFSLQECPFVSGEAGAPGLKFWVPDFVVGSSDGFVVGVESSLFDEVRKEDRRGTLLMQGMSDDVAAIACHPSAPILAIACSNGVLQMWNYDLKLLMVLREFNPSVSIIKGEETRKSRSRNSLRPQCVSIDPTGKILAVGFSAGSIKLLDTESLEDLSTYTPGSESIEDIQFSPSGTFLAAYDNNRHVLLFRRDVAVQEPLQDLDFHALPFAKQRSIDANSYTYVGRSLSHTAPVTGIAFGSKDSVETLISVSEDQYCVEYDLLSSSVSDGVKCVKHYVSSEVPGKNSQRLDLSARPTAIMWFPRMSDDDVEDRFIVANDEFKLKEYNAQSKQCRKTTLAPRFGNPPSKLLPIPFTEQPPTEKIALGSNTVKFFAFATPARVVGLGSFPLDGNPSKVMGIVAHPSDVTSIAVSYDGQYLFTAGGSDLSTNMWRIEIIGGAEDSKISSSLSPFFGLLEGGEGGDLHRDIIDYFYYCQLRHIGEDSMEPRDLIGMIPLDEVPSLFRSVGFYPSEEEVSNFINEVRYRHFMITGETQDYIDLEELIKLYVNHRPALPLDKQLVSSAFSVVRESLTSDESGKLNWNDLLYCLTGEGEKIPEADLNSYLVALTGNDLNDADRVEGYDAKSFAELILGFENF